MLDILAKENSCDGILVKTDMDELKAILAGNVMWACGGIGGIYSSSTNFSHLTGDALAISMRHNIKLKNISYVQIHPTTLYSRSSDRRFLISESVRGEGAHLYDKNGRRFVDELQPRDVVSKAIYDQMKKDGTDHVWLSFLPIQSVDIKTRFPNIYEKCLEEGYDITREWIPVVPAQHYFMGGVDVDLNSHTSMEHLYASGETCCNGVHGANRLASNSLLESLVFAKSAALYMSGKRDKCDDAARLDESAELSMEKLASIYGFDPPEYENTEEYIEKNKKKVLEAINKEKKELA